MTLRTILCLTIFSLKSLMAQNTVFKYHEKQLLDTLKSLNIAERLEKGIKVNHRVYLRQAKVVLVTDTLKYVHKQKYGVVREMVRYKTQNVYMKFYTYNGIVMSAIVRTRNFKNKQFRTLRYFRNKAIMINYRVGRFVEKGVVNQTILNF